MENISVQIDINKENSAMPETWNISTWKVLEREPATKMEIAAKKVR